LSRKVPHLKLLKSDIISDNINVCGGREKEEREGDGENREEERLREGNWRR
jgi:hypothetical protein